MALNENAPYTGTVQYFMQYSAPETYLAPGVVVGGQYEINSQLRTAVGLAGQKITRGGIIAARVVVELEEPLKALLSDMLRPTPATQVTPKTFVFGNQDGEWSYLDCQPGGFTATCAVEESLRVKAEFWALTPTQTEVGDSQEAVVGGLTDNWSDFEVQVAGTDFACQRFELQLLTHPYLYSTLDHRSPGEKRLPVQILLGTQQVQLTLDCAKQIPAATSALVDDEPATDLSVVIAGANVTFTLTHLATPVELGSFRDASGLVRWRYRFIDSAWDALTVT